MDNGCEYVGQFNHEGAKDGKGILYANTGDKYFGDWKSNTYSGEGVYVHSSGQLYKGMLRMGKK